MAVDKAELQKLKDTSRRIREEIVNITYTCGGTHIGGALSQTDLLVALYYKYLHIRPAEPYWPDRDRFILSKGHGGVGHAAILGDLGFFAREELASFNKTGSRFGMHLDWKSVKGVDASTGSLGHGLSIGVGMALGARLARKAFRTYVVLGDGELHGGPSWEAMMAAAQFRLHNLVAFIDRNTLCLDGPTEKVMALEPLADKCTAFGWRVTTIDGHDFEQICGAIDTALNSEGRPWMIIADTIKGKGVDFMENEVSWHYGGLDEAMRDKALASLRRRGA
jgi:transketolase